MKGNGLTAREINALAQSLIMKCQTDGNLTFDGHRKSAAELDNEASARRMADRIARKLAVCRPHEALDLLDTYDLLHRIGHGKQPSSGDMGAYRDRIIEAWRAGDPLLPPARIQRLLARTH